MAARLGLKTKGARPRGLLGPCILLLLSEAPSHGYQLIDPLKLFGFDWGGPGLVYQELRKLDAAGLVRSTWEQGRGPARRVYEPTEAGRMALATFISDVAELAELLRGLLVTAEHMAWAPPEQLDRDAARTSGFRHCQTIKS